MMRGAAWTLCALMTACVQADDRHEAPGETPVIDTARIRLDDALQWRHRRTLESDLNGDGRVERIVLTADVTTNDAGVPLWEDGHRWALFVEEEDRRTLVYGAFVPNGEAEAAVLARDPSDNRRHLFVRERTPQRVRSIVVAYDGPESLRTVATTQFHIEQWLPALAVP